jgi:ligand-binding sensor domain-containing protein
MKYIQVYALFLMLVFCTSCGGQNKTALPKDSIKSETKDIITSHGPNIIVRNIKKDRNGNILIAASFSGVFRYDGKSFTNLTSKVSSARFLDVLEDRRGNLWFASIDSGVYFFDGKSFQHFTTNEGLGSNRVFCIYEDKTGNIWFGTEGGASRYDWKSFQNYMIKSFQTNPNNVNDVYSIIEDKTGKFWFGTSGNACIYDGKTFTVITNKEGNTFSDVRSIIKDKKGNIWLGGNSLWHYDGKTFTNFGQNAGYVYEDSKGNIWTSSATGVGSGTLSRYDVKSLSGKPTVIELNTEPGMRPFGILEANDGSIWFGTLNGVYRYDGKTITDFKSKER